MRLLIIICFFILVVGAPSPSTHVVGSSSKDVPTVAYCDLIRNPDIYSGKLVRISAVYRVGYEWQEFYCLDCFELERRMWVEFDTEESSCPKRVSKRLTKVWEGTFSMTVVGEFQSSGGRYGHENGYRYRFMVKCVEAQKRLLKGGPVPAQVPPAAVKDTCKATPTP